MTDQLSPAEIPALAQRFPKRISRVSAQTEKRSGRNGDRAVSFPDDTRRRIDYSIKMDVDKIAAKSDAICLQPEPSPRYHGLFISRPALQHSIAIDTPSRRHCPKLCPRSDVQTELNLLTVYFEHLLRVYFAPCSSTRSLIVHINLKVFLNNTDKCECREICFEIIHDARVEIFALHAEK